jgi:hypothetical protein
VIGKPAMDQASSCLATGLPALAFASNSGPKENPGVGPARCALAQAAVAAQARRGTAAVRIRLGQGVLAIAGARHHEQSAGLSLPGRRRRFSNAYL